MENYIVISNRDPWTLETFDEVISCIVVSLYNLKYLAGQTDFSVFEQRKRFRDNLEYIRRFYERAERLSIALKDKENLK